jgi:hypothetical protein
MRGAPSDLETFPRARVCGPHRAWSCAGVCLRVCFRVCVRVFVSWLVRVCPVLGYRYRPSAPVEELAGLTSKARGRRPLDPNPDRCFVAPPPSWPRHAIAMLEGGRCASP